MRKILMLLFTLMFVCTMQAQNDITTFLGIPIDGFKTEMRKKLLAKGFTLIQGQDVLQGEFNGTNVNVFIVTNNNKVYRIMVCDATPQDEANIKIRFNKLISQFENNQRYISNGEYSLSESEDISYEMLVHKKTYEAIFFQKPTTENGDVTKKPVWFRIMKEEYGSKYYIAMFYDNEYNHANGEDL